ncbi:MAG: UDP-2,3-diacylglucosamine diphosphatase, partial [Muribaculaceae bacterium]|nr:UDP-2,3-diacylglucosamine diphosphatase [Muribaculaceae bacterium]
MSRSKVYFISDLHLGASYIADARAHEARVVEFLESIAADARELYLVGDVLDYWYEYRYVVPRGFVR